MTEPVIIGECVLYNGDAVEIVESGILDYQSIVSDPPYGMAFRSNHRLVKYEHIENDNSIDHLIWATKLPVTHSKYLFCRWDNLQGIHKPKSFITWVKNNWSMGDLEHEHARQTEGLLFYPGVNHSFPKKRPTDIIYADRTGNNFHPSEKPVSLMERVVEWTEGTVLDMYLGSGSTGVACAKLGRKFIGIELDEKYFDIACKRIEQAYAQPDMFIEPPAKMKHDKLI